MSGTNGFFRVVRRAVVCSALVLVSPMVRADEATISNPPPPPVRSVARVLKPGVMVEVSGSANGANFREFRLEWGRGVSPSSWSNTGVTLAGGGMNRVTNGLLASWNSSLITEADYYSIRLLVDLTTSTTQAQSLVYFEPDLYSTNWPRWLDQAPDHTSAQPVRTPAGATKLALVNPIYLSTTVPSKLWLFELDGSSFTTNALNRASAMQAAVADLDGDPGDEIIVAEALNLRVFQSDGSSVTILPPRFSNFQAALVNAVDLNGDGQREIVALGNDLGGVPDAWLYAWRINGELFHPNYPVRIANANSDLRFGNYNNRVVPLDIDGDGKSELLVVGGEGDGSFSLRMLRWDGTAANWPTQVVSGTFRQLAAGDLDGDGSVEIVLAYSAPDQLSRVQVYSSTGTLRAGWPFQLGGGLPIFLLLADLNRDGASEIIVTEFAKLYALRGDGSKFPGAWPVVGSNFQPLGIPVVADIDGDGVPEIVVTQEHFFFAAPEYREPTLNAYRTNGTLARSWRLLGANGNQPTSYGAPLIGDFDGDGNAEVVVNYYIVSGGGYLHEGVMTVLRLPGGHKPDHRDWPMAYHDPRNSAVAFTQAKLRVAKAGTNIVLSWPMQPDSAVLHFTDDLGTPSWAPLHSIRGDGLHTATITPTNAQRFYRLQYP